MRLLFAILFLIVTNVFSAPNNLNVSESKLNGFSLTKETKTTDEIGTIPNFNFDFVSILKTLAKYEIQEEIKNTKRILAVEESKVTEIHNDLKAKLLNQYYPITNLNLVTLGSKRYFFAQSERLSWMDAVNYCRSHGMDLVSVETKEEDDLIRNHMKTLGKLSNNVYTYMSANSIGRTDLTWLTGETVKYTNWHKGEPNNLSTYHCVVYHTVNVLWGDVECSYLCYFICEER